MGKQVLSADQVQLSKRQIQEESMQEDDAAIQIRDGFKKVQSNV